MDFSSFQVEDNGADYKPILGFVKALSENEPESHGEGIDI
jgi:hypothetical protein